MADDITVSIGADDSALSAIIAKQKANIAELAEGAKIASAGMQQFGLTPEAILPGLSGASKRALESYMAAQKLPPIPPGGGGPPVQEIVAAKDAVHGLVEEFGGMAAQFVKWGLIWKAFEAGLQAVTDGFKQFNDQASVARQAQNAFGLSSEEAQGYLESYRNAARDVGMTWDDWQKFAPTAIHSLEQVGLSANEAVTETKELGNIFENTGADLRKLAPEVELETASFAQLAEAGRLMGPAWAQGVAEIRKTEAAEHDLNIELQHAHTLEQQAIHDAETLSSTREAFAQKTGLIKTAYELFAKTGRGPGAMGGIDFLLYGQGQGVAQMPDWLTKMGSRYRDDFRKMTKEMRQEMAEGAQEMAKEYQIPLSHVQAFIRARAPGFGQQELMAAHGRAEHEADISDEREFQEGNFQRQNNLENSRVAMNDQVRNALKDQNKFLEAQPNLIKKAGDAAVDMAHDLWRETAAMEKTLPAWATGGLALSGLEMFTPLLPGLKAATAAPSPIAPGGTLPKLNVHDQEGADKITGKIDELMNMLRGST